MYHNFQVRHGATGGRPSIACAFDRAGRPAEARDRALSALSPEPGTRGAVAVDIDASDAPLLAHHAFPR